MQHQVKGLILSLKKISNLAVVYDRVLRLSSISASPSPIVSSDLSILLASRGRGKGPSYASREASGGNSWGRFLCTFC